MSPTALRALKPARRRLIIQSHRLIVKLDAVFGPVAHEKVEAGAVESGFIRRKGKIRVITVEDTEVVKSGAACQRIVAVRNKRGWTQQELADRSGIARANIARLEAGRHSPQIDTLNRVAAALGTTPASLLQAPSFADSREDRGWLESGMDEWSENLVSTDKK